MFFPPANLKTASLEPSRFLRGGRGARVEVTPFGRSVTTFGSSKWHHPWYTHVIWQAVTKQWVAVLKPGFVNGKAPIVLVTYAEAQAQADEGTGVDYGINPLTGEPYFSAGIFNPPRPDKDEAVGPGTTLAVPLYFNPEISLKWRNIGWDGESSVPDYFSDRGVNPPPKGQTFDENFNPNPVNLADSTPPKGNRLLRAASIILHQPRQALTSTITLEPGIATGISNVTQTLGIRSAAPGDALKVFSGYLSATAASQIDPLSGDYEEPNFDEITISTVYLLSPPDAIPGSAPDATWQPYVKHSLFWNLNYITPEFVLSTADLTNAFASLTQIATVLAGGTAAIAVNFTAAGLNDLFAQALNMINAHSLAGTFYTPTGGGSTSLFPSLPEVPFLPSSNKAADNAARAAAQRAKLTATLDPAFPYEARPFPISYLI